MKHKPRYTKGAFLLALFLSFPARAEESYSPYAGQHFPQNVYFGDTHLHTNMSIDANGYGNKTLTPDDAYRFARGETLTAHNGMKVALHRPLDFLVVADHAENIGVMPHLTASDPVLLATETGKRWHDLMQRTTADLHALLTAETDEPLTEFKKKLGTWPGNFYWAGFRREGDKSPSTIEKPVGYIGGDDFRRTVWAEVAENAEKHNRPGQFTAFIGYEWSSAGREQSNIHRVVIYRDGSEKTSQTLPWSRIDSDSAEDLWAYMAAYAEQTGGDVLAIPHNGNLSNGEMFDLRDFKGRPFTKSYAELRSRWEPLYEVTQIKGDSETHPILSPNDEFADYERWNSWAGWTYEGIKTEGWEKRKASEYARSALKSGLSEQVRLGVNPFKFGLIGSTDAHTSLAAVSENNFWGKTVLVEPSSYRAVARPNFAGAGYAAVWAEENTRESLFSAMKRRETYATTGPRMTVRFFGGWDYATDDASRPDLAKIGYAGGVPMGGDLTAAPKGKAPSFLIRAVKDADGANLDRVQVIKGWRSADGELHEKIYNVALSDSRKDKGNKTKSVGSTVNVKEASYTNTIGDTELATVWRDPDFKADELAFYYVRVLEIPTPRWTAYDAKYFGLKNIPDEVPMVTQERAYTSPIWYTP